MLFETNFSSFYVIRSYSAFLINIPMFRLTCVSQRYEWGKFGADSYVAKLQVRYLCKRVLKHFVFMLSTYRAGRGWRSSNRSRGYLRRILVCSDILLIHVSWEVFTFDSRFRFGTHSSGPSRINNRTLGAEVSGSEEQILLQDWLLVRVVGDESYSFLFVWYSNSFLL